ncbi:antitoxin VbhA family protein [Thiobacillus denitrificans]|uniref:antitoxin VbhA family protein n=1 Tax=Thiobacillus denitrificans TaxID=36861 RepID=UPI000369E4E2|nr:antitoxin VbhA family protein [Thiobacillus denitrificans]
MQDDTDHQSDPCAASKRKFSAAVDSINADIFAPAKKDRPPVDAKERERRQKQIDTARANVALEGYRLSGMVEEINRRYIAGEIDGDEHGAAIRAIVTGEDGL